MSITKDRLCAAFCEEIEIRKVPAGLAVKTAFATVDGDAIGFYVVQSPDNPSLFRIEDAGLLVPLLEAYGLDLKSKGQQRSEIFERLLSEYRATYDDESCELGTQYMTENELPSAALRFVAMLLRLQDIEFLHPRIIETTFRQDAAKAIGERFKNVAHVEFDSVVSQSLPNYQVDSIVKVNGLPSVAVYFGNSEGRINEAVILKYEAVQETIDCKVVLLLEVPNPRGIAERVLTRAHNRVDAVPIFRTDEKAAMEYIYAIASGNRRTNLH